MKGAMVQGAITGAVAAATEGTSLVSQGMAQAGANYRRRIDRKRYVLVSRRRRPWTSLWILLLEWLSPVVGAKGGSMLFQSRWE